jgi:thiamine pyrophosphate-dependent acetolactate synthase large subunit-like protein
MNIRLKNLGPKNSWGINLKSRQSKIFTKAQKADKDIVKYKPNFDHTVIALTTKFPERYTLGNVTPEGKMTVMMKVDENNKKIFYKPDPMIKRDSELALIAMRPDLYTYQRKVSKKGKLSKFKLTRKKDSNDNQSMFNILHSMYSNSFYQK